MKSYRTKIGKESQTVRGSSKLPYTMSRVIHFYQECHCEGNNSDEKLREKWKTYSDTVR